MSSRPYDIVIIGGGVTGAAILYVLAKYTNVKRVALVERNQWAGAVNSAPHSNSQTVHDGGTETNYGREHAEKAKRGAGILCSYLKTRQDPFLFQKRHRMVIGIGEDDIQVLKNHLEKTGDLYPDLSLIGPEELTTIEPNVMKGRDPRQTIAALISDEGYIVNFQRLAETFIREAQECRGDFPVYYGSDVRTIRREDGCFTIVTNTHTLKSRAIELAAGSYSLYFAQQLGYGMQYAILPMIGRFFSVSNGVPLLKGKVYRTQREGVPFVNVHGDPDIVAMTETRFGPTTKPCMLMELHRYKTIPDFLRLPLVSWKGLRALITIIREKKMLGYTLRNFLYDLPVVGPYFFLREVRPIIPTIRYSDLKRRREDGGIRPQVVDLEKQTLLMGDATLVGEHCIFNTTPSPGATVCLANAKRDAEQLVSFLGEDTRFYRDQFEKDLER